MKNFSNTYIFLFSAGMVILVAAVLAYISESLKPFQNLNAEIEKKQDILRSVGKAQDVGNVENKNTYIINEFAKYIKNSIVVNSKGEVLEGKDAFIISGNLKLELSKPLEQRELPIFIYADEQKVNRYIIPVRGKGLWGPIWGYVAVNDDFNSIYGAVFDHKGETPGLGAEIREIKFQSMFTNKKLFDDSGKFISVEVVKGGTSRDNPYGVDAISGGTITSKGVQYMLFDCIGPYENYFKSQFKNK